MPISMIIRLAVLNVLTQADTQKYGRNYRLYYKPVVPNLFVAMDPFEDSADILWTPPQVEDLFWRYQLFESAYSFIFVLKQS